MGATRKGVPSSLGTVALVAVFALLGAGAAFLAGHTPALAGVSSSGITLRLPRSIWAILFLAPMLIGFASYVVRWAISSPLSYTARIGASGAVLAVVALVLFATVFSANWEGRSTITLGATGPGTGFNDSGPGHGNSTTGNRSSGNGSGSTGGGTGLGNGTGNVTSNGSGNGSTGPNGSGGSSGGGGEHGRGGGSGNNSTSAPLAAAPAGGVSFGITNWVFLVATVALSVIVAVLAIPGVLARVLDRRPRSIAPPTGPSSSAGPSDVRAAIREANLAVAAGETPRDSIVRLYGRLVGRVAQGPTGLTTATAKEIQETRLTELHVPTTRSEALTRMFEEACYSVHPIGRPDADRFAETLRAIEHDIFVAGAPE